MKNVVILMLSQLIIKFIGIVYKLYLTNKSGFGDSGNAILSSALQIYIMTLTISSISLPNAIAKLVSEKNAVGNTNGAHRIFKISIAIFGTIGFFASFTLFLAAELIANKYLHIPEAKLVIMALAPSVFIVSISSIIKGYFNGIEEIKFTAKAQTVEQLFKTAYTVLLVSAIGRISNNNTTLMAGVVGIAISLASVTTLIYLMNIYRKQKTIIWKKINKNKKDSVKNILKGILIVAIPISISSLLAVMTKTIDATTIVKYTKNIVGEGQAILDYGILSGKIEMLISLPFSFNIAFATALIPTVSNLIKKRDYYTLHKRIRFSLLISILIGLFCSSVMYIFSDNILKMLFPNASNGAEMLKVHSVSILIVVITQTMSGILQGLGKATKEMNALAVGLIVKIILNFTLLPRLGIIGAIYATIITQLIVMTMSILYVKKYLQIKIEKNKFILKPMLAMSFVCIFFYFMKNNKVFSNINIIFSILIRNNYLYYINYKN